MSLHHQRNDRIDFIKRIEDPEKVARMSLGGKNKEVAKGGGKEGGKLLLRQKFCSRLVIELRQGNTRNTEERWFMIIKPIL